MRQEGGVGGGERAAAPESLLTGSRQTHWPALTGSYDLRHARTVLELRAVLARTGDASEDKASRAPALDVTSTNEAGSQDLRACAARPPRLYGAQ